MKFIDLLLIILFALILIGQVLILSNNTSPKHETLAIIQDLKYQVLRVENGSEIICVADGREIRVLLENIFAPQVGDNAEPSRCNLEQLCGKNILIKYPKRRGLSEGYWTDTTPELARAEAAFMLNKEVMGICYGESGKCLQTSQLEQGWAKVEDTAPGEWKSLAEDAKKNKKGIWAD